MRAFVTGSTGLLGNNLVRQLVESGWTVTALVRSREKARRVLGDLDVEVVTGDMTDVAGFAEHLDGIDVLFHTAAYFREYYGDGDHWPRLQAVNIDGSLALMKAAHAAGVKRAIDTSSSGILAPIQGREVAEDDVAEPNDLDNLYFRSKVISERQLRAFHETTGFPIHFVLPGWMFGPRDMAPTASGQVVADLLARELPAIPPGGSSVVDARDVARAMIAMAECGEPGRRYIVAGRYASLAEIAALVEQVSGVPGPRIHLPYAVAIALAWLSEAWARLTGTETVMTVSGIRALSDGHRISSARAEDELGIRFRPLEETLRDEVAWIRGEVPTDRDRRAA